MQNGDYLTIIDFNMPDIWQTMPDSQTITVKQNVKLHGRMHTSSN